MGQDRQDLPAREDDGAAEVVQRGTQAFDGARGRRHREAFGADAFGWGDPESLVKNLFASKTFAPQRAIYDAVERFVQKFDGAVLSPRKGYVALYRLKQFGAVKPSKDGLLVGLAMQKYPKSKKLVDVKNLGGGDRTKKALLLSSAKDFDAEAKDLITAAWTEN